MKPIFDTCTLGIGYEFVDVDIVTDGGKWLVLIGEIKLIDWQRNRFEVQFRYLNGSLGGLAWINFKSVPIGHIPIRIKDWRTVKQQEYFESVTWQKTAASNEDESVTEEGCAVCGKQKSPRAKTCSPACRKRLSRTK